MQQICLHLNGIKLQPILGESHKVTDIKRIGKVLKLELSGKTSRILAFHKRMSGRLLITNETSAPKHVHAVVSFSDGSYLWLNDPRKFGRIWYGDKQSFLTDPYLSSLGPDALGVSLSIFKERLTRHKGMIKPVLLRQDVVAGIGNIIADETLWASKVHPRRPISKLSAAIIKNLHAQLQKVLRRGIRAQGTTLRDWQHPDGTDGSFQDYFKVYGRGAQLCARCGGMIKRIVVGSRGTWICAKCQK